MGLGFAHGLGWVWDRSVRHACVCGVILSCINDEGTKGVIGGVVHFMASVQEI